MALSKNYATTKRQFNDSDENNRKKKTVTMIIENDFTTGIDCRQTFWYRIYWLDESIICDPFNEYGINQSKLRGIIDYLEVYRTANKFMEDIEGQRTKDGPIIVIITMSNKFDLMSKLHEVSHIYSIYIYVPPAEEFSTTDRSVLNAYTKVKGIYNQPNLLINKLSQDIRQLTHSLIIFQDLNSNVREHKKELTTAPYFINQRNPSQDWFNTLLNVLEENQPGFNGKQIFIKYCCELYQNEPNTLRIINEFQSNYSSEQAIQWYTRDGFLYRLLNQALRQQDQNLIILLHFFIFDLEQQLLNKLVKDNQSEHMNIEVYRGQLMSIDEINVLIRKLHRSMFFCSFLSTTIDRDVALMFSGAGSYTRDNPIQPVIFHIKYETFQPTRGIANIQDLSFSRDEGEILLSPLHVLTPVKIDYDEEIRAYTVKCTASGDRYDMRTDLDQRLIELDVVLRILIENESISDPINNEECSQFIEDIILLRQELVLPKVSNVTLDICDNEEISSQVFQLRILQSFNSNSLRHTSHIRSDIAATLQDCLGTLFQCKGQFQLALKHYDKAASYDDSSNRKYFTRKVNIAQTYKMMGNYELAWRMSQQLLEEPDSANLYNLYQYIAFVTPFLESDHMPIIWLRKIYDYLEYIRQNSTSDLDTDDELEEIDDNLSEAYGTLGRYFWYRERESEYALLCYQREMEIIKSRMIDIEDWTNATDLAEIYQQIADVYYEFDTVKAVEFYEQAIHTFSKHEQSYSAELAVCWSRIAYIQNEKYLEHFQRAFNILLTISSVDTYDLKNDNIGECFFYLAKKFATSFLSTHQAMALKWSEQALCIYLMNENQFIFDRELNNYVELVLRIYSNENTSITFTKEQLIEKWSSNKNDSLSLDNKQIQQMLQETITILTNIISNDPAPFSLIL